jgi:hypothetical protein
MSRIWQDREDLIKSIPGKRNGSGPKARNKEEGGWMRGFGEAGAWNSSKEGCHLPLACSVSQEEIRKSYRAKLSQVHSPSHACPFPSSARVLGVRIIS